MISLQDMSYQDRALANAKTKADIKAGLIRGGFTYWALLPTTEAMVSFVFPIAEGEAITPLLKGILSGAESISLYYAVNNGDGTFSLGQPVSSFGDPVAITATNSYMDLTLPNSDGYFLVKTATVNAVGVQLMDTSPYNVYQGNF
jgi:hypothetical protein